MNSKPLVSIIVGCYNVAKWLHEGRLDDIYNQTYTNWELILVDDGSTDETPAMLDEIQHKFQEVSEFQGKSEGKGLNHETCNMKPSVKVIHKENGGLGSARNAGLNIANGDYIWSFDVDDHVEPTCIEYCVREAEQRQVDVLMFGFYAITPQFGTKETIELQETVINNQQELRDAYLDRILFVPNGNGFFWNKFYRRSFIEKHHLRFADQRIQQDEYFNLKVYEHLEKCYISPRVFYHYYIYNSGNNRSKFITNRFDIYMSIIHQFRHLQHKWNLTDERFEDYLQKRLYSNVGQCLIFNLFHEKCPWTKEERQKELDKIMADKEVHTAIDYCEKKGLSFEQRMYLNGYRSGSLKRINAMRMLFAFLRTMKSKLGR